MLDIPLHLRENLGRPLTSAELDYNFKFLQALYYCYYSIGVAGKVGLVDAIKHVLSGEVLDTAAYDSILAKHSIGHYKGLAPFSNGVYTMTEPDNVGTWTDIANKEAYYLVFVPANTQITINDTFNPVGDFQHYEKFVMYTDFSDTSNAIEFSYGDNKYNQDVFLVLAMNNYTVTVTLGV